MSLFFQTLLSVSMVAEDNTAGINYSDADEDEELQPKDEINLISKSDD